jgi:hypothetical protein
MNLFYLSSLTPALSRREGEIYFAAGLINRKYEVTGGKN